MRGPIFSFTFDDGNISQIKDYYPVLKKYNFPATFYVVATEVGRPGKISTPDLEALLANRSEIGSHGFSHKSMLEIKPDEVSGELKRSYDMLRPYGVRSFAYPFGDCSDTIALETSRLYDSGRGYQRGVVFNSLASLNRYALKSFSIDGHDSSLIDPKSPQYVLSPDTLSQREDAWFIFTLHGRTSVNTHSVGDLMRGSILSRRKVSSILNDVKQRLSPGNGDSMRRLDAFCERLAQTRFAVYTVSAALDEIAEGRLKKGRMNF